MPLLGCIKMSIVVEPSAACECPEPAESIISENSSGFYEEDPETDTESHCSGEGLANVCPLRA